ncbi:MAG TPA: HAD-IG family 5'-nucleotidase [Pseudobdellovibrionaceae bacterium]|nr:HAD-IG family 5'-nucleotidase [Pseudobdellovibrionaceae bacterium]
MHFNISKIESPGIMSNKVYVNRTLNLKKIKYLGLDMDHTLIRYKSENFEKLAYTHMIQRLVDQKGYPQILLSLKFDHNIAIRGLVIDRPRGNLLKLNRYASIRAALHGTKPLDFKTLQKIYKSTYIDLNSDDYLAIDTAFSISMAVLYSQVIEVKDSDPKLTFPNYSVVADDLLEVLDDLHRDGTLKNIVRKNLEHYLIKDPLVVEGLEKFKRHEKKIFLLTNSDFHYTKLLLDYAINPFLKDHKDWSELFEYVITFAQKPKFFYEEQRFLSVDPQNGTMTNIEGKIIPGVYQGGGAKKFTREIQVQGDDILYLGDHIYGDILRLKKDCNWRTAMVVEELDIEIEQNKKAEPTNQEIEHLMKKKEPMEDRLTLLTTEKIDEQHKAQKLSKEYKSPKNIELSKMLTIFPSNFFICY